MSMWRKFAASGLKNVDKAMLRKACNELGFDFDESIKTVMDSYDSANVDAGFVDLETKKAIPIGFIFNEQEGLQISGDFWNYGCDEKTLTAEIAKTYQKHLIISQMEENDFTVDTVETNDKGEVVIEAYAC